LRLFDEALGCGHADGTNTAQVLVVSREQDHRDLRADVTSEPVPPNVTRLTSSLVGGIYGSQTTRQPSTSNVLFFILFPATAQLLQSHSSRLKSLFSEH
jgi:hypothetical protein